MGLGICGCWPCGLQKLLASVSAAIPASFSARMEVEKSNVIPQTVGLGASERTPKLSNKLVLSSNESDKIYVSEGLEPECLLGARSGGLGSEDKWGLDKLRHLCPSASSLVFCFIDVDTKAQRAV